MTRKAIILSGILVFCSIALFSQQKDTARKVRLNHYSLTIGAGWTHYYNNLDYGDQKINQDFAGLSFKFFWEPEHRLSLGLETGYYKMFKITDQITADTSIEVDRTVVPLLLLVRMRIIDNVYLGAGMGLAFIYNKAAGPHREVTTKTTSLSNYKFTASYIYPLAKHWRVGGEIMLFNFGTYDDWMYSIQAVCAVRL
jgi:hypothetical protein